MGDFFDWGINCDSLFRYVVTLGHEDNLQCLSNPKHTMDTNKNFLLVKKLQSREIKDLFKRPTTGFEPRGMQAGKAYILVIRKIIDFPFRQPHAKGMSWVQIQLLEQRETEYHNYFSDRMQCLDDLEALKRKLRNLIDANELAPDDEQLPIQEFNFDWEGLEIATQNAQLQRFDEESNIRNECANLNALTDAIKTISWNQMDVKGRNIRGIFTRLKVENYALLFPEKTLEQELQKVRVWRTTEKMVTQHDSFQPWVPLPMEELVALLGTRPYCTSPRNPESLGGADSNEGSSSALTMAKNQFTLTGTPSHVFITPISLRYSQLEVVTYYQMYLENILGHVSHKGGVTELVYNI